MKKRSFLWFATVLMIGWTGIVTAQESKVSPEVWEKAKTKGVVRVMVQLDVPWQPEGKLSKDEVLKQRKAIAAAQDEVLAELAGTKHKVSARFEIIRFLSLEVGLDSLAVLDRSARVVRVTEVGVLKPHLEQGMPREK